MALADTRTLSSPLVRINGRSVSIIPESLKRTIAPGERKVRTTSAGPALAIVVGTNLEEKKAKVQFDLANTASNQRLVEELAALADQGIPATLEVIEATKQVYYEQMFLTNNPEGEHKSDGNIPLEFEGLQRE